jgi:hypothetical protein
MVRKVLVAVLLTGFVASVAGAATIYMDVSQLGTYGWDSVVIKDSSGRGDVNNRTDAGVDGIQFTNGDQNKTRGCAAVISTAAFAGVSASSITALNIRVYGTEGDGTNWQPPVFVFPFAKAPGNLSNRYAWWIPWTDGVARSPQTWQTYDALVDGTWYVPNVNVTKNTFAELLAAYPSMYFPSDADLATMGNFPAGAHSFNVGYVAGGTAFDAYVGKYSDSARGSVDWFEVGINGVTTRYDLGVPEPATMGLLALGGLAMLRRRR